ncbi:hypothetical protein MXB_1943 [Myxobolus squamalis]|nr:hypothetical protein MXB_1943 [Myxobolus squamalis]
MKFVININLLNDSPDVCKHFICGRPRHILKETTGFVLGNTVCIIPLEHTRDGILKHGANFMECSGIGKNVIFVLHKFKFCFNGECINDTKSVDNLNTPRVKCVNVALFK